MAVLTRTPYKERPTRSPFCFKVTDDKGVDDGREDTSKQKEESNVLFYQEKQKKKQLHAMKNYLIS